MFIYRFLLLIFIILFSSCATKKNVLFVQDTDPNEIYEFQYSDYKIKVDDILKITISADNLQAALPYNPSILNTNNNISKESLTCNGYIVDSDGFIYIPNLHKINVLDLTISEIRSLIQNKLISENLLTDPNVDVKMLNYNFTILGEVSSPGRYEFNKNNLNILEAIGIAGDLTINGKRNDIKIIRDLKGKKYISSVDLTKSDFLMSDSFQIVSGDIILVDPNTSRIKNAGIIGNSGTLLSLLSFILSSIIVISN